MRKLFLTVFLITMAAWACADFPGSPIGGGGGTTLTTGSVTSAHVADNAIKNVDVASDAGIAVTKISGLGTIATQASDNVLITGGSISGVQHVVTILDNVSGPSAAQSYGSLNRVTGAITVLLPAAVAGMSTCVMDSGTAHDIIVDVQGGDTMTLSGTEQAAGVGITNASGSSTGDMVCVVAHAANKWSTTGTQGTWASQ